MLDEPKKLARGKQSSLFCFNVSDEEKKFYNIGGCSEEIFGIAAAAKLKQSRYLKAAIIDACPVLETRILRPKSYLR
jgi:hypothetical protein